MTIEDQPPAAFYNWVRNLNQSVSTARSRYASRSTGSTRNAFYHNTPVTDENFALGRMINDGSVLIVDIVVRNYIYSLGPQGIERKEKKYVGTSIMAARLPSPTLEDIKERIAKSPYHNSWLRPSAEELKWRERRELELSVNDNMKGKNFMPVKSRSERGRWFDNIRQNNPDRLGKRVFGYLYGESADTAAEIIRENNNTHLDDAYNFEYYSNENSVMQRNPTTGRAEFIPGEYGSFYVKSTDFTKVSNEELQKMEEEIAKLT
jgi:hypothetical protein